MLFCMCVWGGGGGGGCNIKSFVPVISLVLCMLWVFNFILSNHSVMHRCGGCEIDQSKCNKMMSFLG